MRLAPRPGKTAAISLTPLVDVVFILLIFFMLASSFMDWRQIEVTTTASQGSASQARDSVTITVEDSDRYVVDGQRMDGAALRGFFGDRLKQNPELPLTLRSGTGASVQAVVDATALLAALGAANVSLIGAEESPAGALAE